MLKPKFNQVKMKAKPLTGLLLAVFTVALFASITSAAGLNLSNVFVEVDGLPAEAGNVALVGGDMVPIQVEFMANQNARDVEISAWIQGFRSETRVDKPFADLISGSKYVSRMSLKVPLTFKEDGATERDLVLVIRIESDEGSFEIERSLNAQRQSRNIGVLLVEFDGIARPDSTLPVSVVLKNFGRHEEENVFVTISIPQLGISKTAFFEDLFPIDVCDDDGDCDRSDSRERRIFLSIPNGVTPGVYEVRVKAVSDDTETVVVKPLNIVGTPIEGRVLANPLGKTFALGETATYEMVLVNTGNKIAVYNIVPQTNDALSIELSDTLTTVPAGSSKTILVKVRANREGTHNFSVSAVSEGFAQTATYAATVQGKSITSSTISGGNNMIVLTVVLAVIFVVLLIILIVLLTKKPEKSEEFGESYY